MIVIFIAMKDPYNWHFPQRNETMFMATIGTALSIQRTACTRTGKYAILPSRRLISLVRSPGGRFLSRSIDPTSPTPLTLSLFLRVIA